MNRLLFPLVFIVGLLFSGCSDNDTVFDEPLPVRAYETDAQILSRFVEVDRRTGKFVINPDRRISVPDYIMNHSREELMAVSPVNRNKFLREMEEVNSLLHSISQSGLSAAIIYSTYASDVVVDGNNTGSLRVEKLPAVSAERGDVAHLLVIPEGNEPVKFYGGQSMIMNLSRSNRSMFYFYQLSFGDGSNPDGEIVIVAGVNSPLIYGSYRILNQGGDGIMVMNGRTLVGDGTLSVSIAR